MACLWFRRQLTRIWIRSSFNRAPKNEQKKLNIMNFLCFFQLFNFYYFSINFVFFKWSKEPELLRPVRRGHIRQRHHQPGLQGQYHLHSNILFPPRTRCVLIFFKSLNRQIWTVFSTYFSALDGTTESKDLFLLKKEIKEN